MTETRTGGARSERPLIAPSRVCRTRANVYRFVLCLRTRYSRRSYAYNNRKGSPFSIWYASGGRSFYRSGFFVTTSAIRVKRTIGTCYAYTPSFPTGTAAYLSTCGIVFRRKTGLARKNKSVLAPRLSAARFRSYMTSRARISNRSSSVFRRFHPPRPRDRGEPFAYSRDFSTTARLNALALSVVQKSYAKRSYLCIFPTLPYPPFSHMAGYTHSV